MKKTYSAHGDKLWSISSKIYRKINRSRSATLIIVYRVFFLSEPFRISTRKKL